MQGKAAKWPAECANCLDLLDIDDVVSVERNLDLDMWIRDGAKPPRGTE